jgi:PAS domain S-box-containing protein
MFAVLMALQWLAGLAAAYWVSPRTWVGTTSQTHVHVWLALFLGGAISLLPIGLALTRPGHFSTRYVIAVGQMLMGALLIHLTGGRIETHFHVFGSLAFLSFYRDWRVLVPATLVVAADHFLRGLFWPQSVYGVFTASEWRWLEHAGWVLFEDTFLFIAIKRSLSEMWDVAVQTNEVRCLNEGLEGHVAERTSQLAASNQELKKEVAERKLAEEASRESETRYRQLFHDALTGDFISTPDGELLDCNMAFARMFGFSSIEEAKACNLVSIYPNEKDREDLLERLRREKRLEYCELEMRRRDGTTVHAVENIIGSFDESGELVGLRGYIFDDTKRKELEDQLRQSQKMEAVGKLAGGVAHDFNNLLTAINGYSELSMRRLDEGDPLYRNLSLIKKAGDRAASLTRQLLAFSRKQILKPAVLDLNNAIVEMNKMLQRLIGEDIDLLIGLTPDLGKVKADPSQIEQVLMNLAVNARDAMPMGGKLTIETSNVEIDREYINRQVSVRPGHYILLAVSDNGCGMNLQTQERIFEPFFTTKEVGKGTGLGLSTVYGIVKQSGGHVWVYSEVGIGTTFKVYLPRVDAPSEEAVVSTVETKLQIGTETVLLVEDEEIVRSMTREILQESGYQVLSAEHAEDALQVVGEHSGPIHLLLSDVVMPGLSGRELAEQLAPLRKEMKVLYMSGYTDDAIVHHGVLEEGTAFIEKPFTPLTLSRKVREVLNTTAEVKV